MTTILNFNGLYGDTSGSALADFIHCESLETRSKQYDWSIKRHIHTHLAQVFCVEVGTGKLLAEQQEVPFSGPCFILIPENTLHGFRFDADVQGTVLTLSISYIERLFNGASLIRLTFSKLHLIPAGESSLFGEGLRLIENIRHELFSNLPERTIMLQALLTTFLTTVFRLSYLQNEHGLSQNNRSLALFQGFMKQVREAYTPQKTITDYAHELRISPVHLNRICRAVTQLSALQVVQRYFIEEARNYLIHTSFSISEVAYALNFDDPAYFSRLFRQHTGQSPKAYREAQTAAIHKPINRS